MLVSLLVLRPKKPTQSGGPSTCQNNKILSTREESGCLFRIHNKSPCFKELPYFWLAASHSRSAKRQSFVCGVRLPYMYCGRSSQLL
jgi:hypothetical protein